MFMFGMDPEEYQKKIEEDKLHQEAHRHDMHEWLESMDEQGLKMFRATLFDYSDNASAAYLIGFAAFLLQHKFGICAACGKNHNEVLTTEDIIGESGDTGNSSGPHIHTPERGDTVTHGKAFQEMSGPELLVAVPRATQDQMDEYGVDFVEFQWPKVICRGCATEYVSLDDRMLRDPGVKGCTGCQSKTKWG